ncbi:hypothetical protein CQA55_27845, partial [Klebsiella pneumoniae]
RNYSQDIIIPMTLVHPDYQRWLGKSAQR